MEVLKYYVVTGFYFGFNVSVVLYLAVCINIDNLIIINNSYYIQLDLHVSLLVRLFPFSAF